MPQEETAPPVEMKMSPDEFAELRAQAAAVGVQDVHLGRVLDLIILHLGHAHDLDPAVEDAKAKAAAEEQAAAASAKAAEDAKAAEQAAAAPVVAPAQEGA